MAKTGDLIEFSKNPLISVDGIKEEQAKKALAQVFMTQHTSDELAEVFRGTEKQEILDLYDNLDIPTMGILIDLGSDQ